MPTEGVLGALRVPGVLRGRLLPSPRDDGKSRELCVLRVLCGQFLPHGRRTQEPAGALVPNGTSTGIPASSDARQAVPYLTIVELGSPRAIATRRRTLDFGAARARTTFQSFTEPLHENV